MRREFEKFYGEFARALLAQALATIKDSLQVQPVKESLTTEAHGMASCPKGKCCMTDTADIDQPTSATIDAAEFKALLALIPDDLEPYQEREIVKFTDAHCAQQVAAACSKANERLLLQRDSLEQSEMDYRSMLAHRDDLRAQLARNEQAEPVAWLATDLDGHGDVAFTKEGANLRAGYGCDTLIPLLSEQPIAQPAPRIPDKWLSEVCGPEVDDLSYGQGYRRGFNDCRDKVIAASADDWKAQRDAEARQSAAKFKDELDAIENAAIAKFGKPAPDAPAADERAAFEAWAVTDDGGWLPCALKRNDEAGEHANLGDYTDDDVQAQWYAWQARAALHRPVASVPVHIGMSQVGVGADAHGYVRGWNDCVDAFAAPTPPSGWKNDGGAS